VLYSKLRPLPSPLCLSEAACNPLQIHCYQALSVPEIMCHANSVWLLDSDADISQLADLDT